MFHLSRIRAYRHTPLRLSFPSRCLFQPKIKKGTISKKQKNPCRSRVFLCCSFYATKMVETIGIEPMTSCMSSKHSNQLSYASEVCRTQNIIAQPEKKCNSKNKIYTKFYLRLLLSRTLRKYKPRSAHPRRRFCSPGECAPSLSSAKRRTGFPQCKAERGRALCLWS